MLGKALIGSAPFSFWGRKLWRIVQPLVAETIADTKGKKEKLFSRYIVSK
jgi:hypothetical protein